ncbi:MAG: phosphoglucosamine mutase [Moorea sp. SIO2B7]|nr:phosphoglucosamine mutase [Moorena sp. SIO2B7]
MVTSLYQNQKVSNWNVQDQGLTALSTQVSSFGYLSSLPKTPLFGTDGIRGKVGQLLSAPLALQVGFWSGQVLRELASNPAPVIIGQDSRNSSDMLAMAIAAGLTSAGLEVWNLGLCPTPCVAYLTSATNAIGGIMISASHNPPEDNGIKFFVSNGTKLSKLDTQKIEAALRGKANSRETKTWGKHYYRQSLVGDYVKSLQRSLPKGIDFQGMRIVLDMAWGASVNTAPSVFQELGAEVICLHDKPDGDRINVNCGSTHLHKLQEAIKQHSADMGFAFDGDADRVMAVDAKGRVVDGDYILYLWGKTLKEKGKLPENLIIATVMANLGFERAWQQLGGKLIRTAVGDQHVQAQMWHSGAMLGGEQSGHILCHHHGVSGDGVQTALHLAALVSQSGTSLASLVAQSFQTYPQLLRNVRVEDRDRRRHWQDCEPLQRAIAKAEKAMGDQGRILVRASGTEPVIRVMVEAADAQIAEQWTQQLVKAVQQHLVG